MATTKVEQEDFEIKFNKINENYNNLLGEYDRLKNEVEWYKNELERSKQELEKLVKVASTYRDALLTLAKEINA